MRKSLVIRFLTSFLLSTFVFISLLEQARAEVPLPDLVVRSLKQLSNGKLELVIGNDGTGEYRYIQGGEKPLNISIVYQGGTIIRGGVVANRLYPKSILLLPGATSEPWILDVGQGEIGAATAKLFVDRDNKIPESNDSESSNVKEIPLTIPDFKSVLQYFLGNPARRDQRPVVNVANIGSSGFVSGPEGTSGALKINWQWIGSSGSVISEGSTYMGSTVIPNTGGGIAVPLTNTGDIPVNAIALKTFIDGDNVFPELNENNNTNEVYIDVALFPENTQGVADLIIESATRDQSRRIAITIKNIGTAPISLPSQTPFIAFDDTNNFLTNGGNPETTVIRSIDSTQVISIANGGILPGQSVSYTSNKNILNDSTGVTLTLDPGNVLAETKGNNIKTVVLTMPDLTFSPITFDSNNTALVELKNSGNGTALVEGNQVRYTISYLDESDTLVGSGVSGILSGELQPGYSTIYRVAIPNSQAGNNTLGLAKKIQASIVYDESLYYETATANNVVVANMPNPPIPDLSLKNARIVGSTIEFEIENMSQTDFTGLLNAEYVVNLEIDPPGSSPQSWLDYVPNLGTISLPAGNTRTQSFPNPLGNRAGTLELTIRPTAPELFEHNTTSLYIQGESALVATSSAQLQQDVAVQEVLAELSDIQSTPEIVGNATPSAVYDPNNSPKATVGLLPDNPLYFVKEGVREVEVLLTSDPEKKIKKRKKTADEKILEAKILSDEGKKKEAAQHLGSYEKSMGKVAKESEKKQQKDKGKDQTDKSDEIALDILTDQIHHQTIIDAIMKDSLPEDATKIAQAKQKSLDSVGAISKNVAGEKLTKHLADSLKNTHGPFEVIRQLEVIENLQDSLSDDQNESLRGLKDEKQQHIINTLDSLNSSQKKTLPDYLQASGSDLSSIKVLDDLKFNESQTETKMILEQSEDSVLKTIADTISNDVVDSLDKSSVEDLRLVSKLENRVDGEVKSDLLKFKQESANELYEKIKSLSEEDRAAFIKDNIESQLDISQVQLINELAEEAKEDDRVIASLIATDLDDSIQEKFENKKARPEEYANFIDSFVSSSPNDLNYLKEYVTISGKEFEAELIDNQIDYFEEYYKNSTDPDEIEAMQKFIETNEEWGALFDEYADSDFWEEESNPEQVDEQSEEIGTEEENVTDDEIQYEEAEVEEETQIIEQSQEEEVEETPVEESEEEESE